MIRKAAMILVAAGLPVLADFSYEHSSKVTGGMMAGMMKFAGAFSKQAREPMVSTVAVKGNRLVSAGQSHASIIDLDKETITNIQFDKKQYSVTTFAQMKQMMDDMSQRMKSSPDAQRADVHYKVSVKDTGEKKTIAGFDTHEVIITMEMEGTDNETGSKGGMAMTPDMWIAPKAAGYDELAGFYKRMFQKLDWTPNSMGMMGARPDMAKGMAELYKESSKMSGMPIVELVKMGVHAEGQGGQAAQGPPPQQEQQAEKPSIGSVLGGRFGGFGRKKKNPDESAGDAPPQGHQGDVSGSLMEMTMEMSAFSSAPVDEARFVVPAGFKQVEPEAVRRRR